ncbi:Ig-like domain-containing protein, partial [Mesorhizobium sp. B2-4-15]|uniref:beta strand repeat-containing protein n=1 Tax=Mesorhizobium sp. B2-4-15 TaxID=2589934 RepID=UPI001AEE4879
TDGDGDQSQTTLTLHIGDAGVTVTPPAIGTAADTVYEAGLADGSQQGLTQTVASGTIAVGAPDGVASITVGGAAVALDGTHTTVADGTRGSLEAWWNGTAIQYQYTLQNNHLESPAANNGQDLEAQPQFAVVVTDQDGSTGNGALTINIVDDVPTAHADALTIAAADFAGHGGNVITGTGEDSPAVAADVQGADGASVTSAYGKDGAGSAQAVTAGGVSVAGQYGTLLLHADGSYTYTRAAGSPGGVDDVFHYTLTDGDGDQSQTTLTLHIGDAGVTVTPPAIGTAADTVYEAGLADGSQQGLTQTVASGTIAVGAPDGVASITVGGAAVALDGTHTTVADGTRGSLEAWWNGTAIQYQYTLQNNHLESPAANNGQDLEAQPQFAVVVTDQDGSTGNGALTINIVDDVPTAHADTDSVTAGSYGPELGNVITAVGTTSSGADTLGADGAVVAGVAAGSGGNLDNAATVGAVIHGTYGDLTLQANGDYSYARHAGTPGGVDDVFTYTLKDGDGDLSHTTLTISIGDSGVTTTVPVAGTAGAQVSEAGLPPHGALPAGSGESADGLPNNNSDTSETTTGSITYTAPDGPATVTIGGLAVSAVGQTFAGSFGTLTITSIAAGSVGYSYTLTTNTSGDTTHDDFAVSVTDADGDHNDKTLTINIVDDVPTAHADTDSVTAGSYGPELGNVITA